MKRLHACLFILGCSAMVSGFCAEPAPASAPAPATATPTPGPAPAEYRPSMGDLMTMAVQPRHLKLGLAGRAGNWTYAAFEISELRNAFARIARTIPVYRNSDTAAMTAAMIQEPINAVESAIKEGNASRFTTSYQQLTQACNACHQAQAHAFVVIKVPTQDAYPNQDFRVPKQ